MRGKTKILTVTIFAAVLSLVGISKSANAVESPTLKANFKAEPKILTITFTEDVKLNGVALADTGKDKISFLKEFFNYEFPGTTEVANEDSFLNMIDSSKISVETTNNSVKLTLSDGAKTGSDGLLRFAAFLDLDKITDVNGNTLNIVATGDLVNLKTKSARRIRIESRATYDSQFDLDVNNAELSFILAKGKDEWTAKQAEIAADIKKEAEVAKIVKEALASGDEAKIKEANEKVKTLTRASSVKALTVETKKPAQEVKKEPAVKEEKKTEIQAPNTGFERTDAIFHILISGIALAGATYFAIKKA